MALIVSGITIPTSGTPIKVGSTTIDKVVCNGVTVWERVVFTSKDFSYTGGIQSVKVPAGLYKLEVWGAQGGNAPSESGGYNNTAVGGIGGYGGYSCRYYYFSSETTLYVGVGGQGFPVYYKTTDDKHKIPPSTGYNGGGPGWTIFYVYPLSGGTGGGATHIAMTNNRGELKNYASYKSEILVVAGGGGGGSTLTTSRTDPVVANQNRVLHFRGGDGGGLTGSDGNTISGVSNYGIGTGKGGTQSAGGRTMCYGEGQSNLVIRDGSFGLGGYCNHSCYVGGTGGGGYYGGGAGQNYNGGSPGGGGSSYIGVSSYVHNGTTYTNNTIAGQQTGNGKAKITFISS